MTHPSRIRVLILNPKVGLMVEMSSPASFLRMVVFPALSRPLLRSASYAESENARSCIVQWIASEQGFEYGGCTNRNNTLISFDLALFFRMMVSRPMRSWLWAWHYLRYDDHLHAAAASGTHPSQHCLDTLKTPPTLIRATGKTCLRK